MDIVGTEHSALKPTQDWVLRSQVDDYVLRLQAGDDVGAITVQRHADGSMYILDGHHLYVASQQTGIPLKIKYIDGPGPFGLLDWLKVLYEG